MIWWLDTLKYNLHKHLVCFIFDLIFAQGNGDKRSLFCNRISGFVDNTIFGLYIKLLQTQHPQGLTAPGEEHQDQLHTGSDRRLLQMVSIRARGWAVPRGAAYGAGVSHPDLILFAHIGNCEWHTNWRYIYNGNSCISSAIWLYKLVVYFW